MDDGTTVTSDQIYLKSADNEPEITDPWEPEEGGGRESPTMEEAEAAVIPPNTQSCVTVMAKRNRLDINQPHSRLYYNNMLTCTNGVVKIEPKRFFRVLVANFFNVPEQVVGNQKIVTVLPNPLLVIPTHIITAEVLGIVQEKGEYSRKDTKRTDETGRFDPSNLRKTPTKAYLDL